MARRKTAYGCPCEVDAPPPSGPGRRPNNLNRVPETSNRVGGLRLLHEAETVSLDLTRAECGRSPRARETWRILFAAIGEAVTYCPECAEREFGETDQAGDAPLWRWPLRRGSEGHQSQ
jgi:hypothetical protein